MSETAELIRNAREQRGLSQRALAERAGVEQSTIARIELGDSDPAYSTVIRLLDAAGFRLPEPQPSIATLAEAATGSDELDWTMLRSVTDLAERDPSTVVLLVGVNRPPRQAPPLERSWQQSQRSSPNGPARTHLRGLVTPPRCPNPGTPPAPRE